MIGFSSARRSSGLRFVTQTLVAMVSLAVFRPAVSAEPERRQSAIASMAFSSDDSAFVTAGATIRLYETETGNLLFSATTGSQSRTATFIPNEKSRFVEADLQGTVRIWNAPDPKPIKTLPRHEGPTFEVAVSPNGKWLATAKGGFADGRLLAHGAVRIWQLPDGELAHTISVKESGATCVAFSNDGRHLAFARAGSEHNEAGTVQLVETETWKVRNAITLTPGIPCSLAFSNAGDRLLIVGGKSRRLNPLNKGRKLVGQIWSAALHDTEAKDFGESNQCGYFHRVAFLPNSDLFVVATRCETPDPISNSSRPPCVQMWDLKGAAPIWTQAIDEGGMIFAMAVSHNGKIIGCCATDEIFLLDADTGAVLKYIESAP